MLRSNQQQLWLFASLRFFILRGAGMAQWWEHSPPSDVAGVRFPDLVLCVGCKLVGDWLIAPFRWSWWSTNETSLSSRFSQIHVYHIFKSQWHLTEFHKRYWGVISWAAFCCKVPVFSGFVSISEAYFYICWLVYGNVRVWWAAVVAARVPRNYKPQAGFSFKRSLSMKNIYIFKVIV